MANYSVQAAIVDLVQGARNPRAPVRRVKLDGIGFGWQAVLVVLAGFGTSFDLLVNPPLTAADLPAGFPEMPAIALTAAILGAIVVTVLAVWFLVLPGTRLMLRHMSLRQVGSALALGSWSALLPSAAVTLVGLLIAPQSDVPGLVAAMIGLAYGLLSLAEFGEVGIWRAFLALLFGTLLMGVVAAAAILAGAVLLKTLGVPVF